MHDVTTAEFHEEFEQAFPTLPLKYNVSWRELTSLGVGKEISILAEPPDDISLAHLLRFCWKRNIEALVVGGGTDTVGCDGPFNGIVVRLCQNDFIRIRPGRRHVTAGAGVRLSDLVSIAARRGFGGIVPLAAIPGTIGGALRMNAGAHGVQIGDFVSELCGYDFEGNPWAVSGHEIKWGYRCSDIPWQVVITAAIFRLPEVNKIEEQEKINLELRERRAHEPRGRSAGCAFKNVSSNEPAGRLIDLCGFKDSSCGDALVSKIHANYILNTGHAKEHDVITLMKKIRAKVACETGFYLEPEVCFAKYESVLKIKDDPKAPTVIVLKGGNSRERDVSLESGAAVAAALRCGGYPVKEIDITECKLSDEIIGADIIFPALHGGFGENGDLQKLLEDSAKKFVGCGSQASAVVMDKILSKKLMDKQGIPNAPWAALSKGDRKLPENLQFPVVIKSPCEGSTFGILIARNHTEWENALASDLAYDSELLVEQYIEGTEITIGIVGEEALPVIEIKSPNGFYDYDAKYTHANGETQYLCPPETVSKDIQAAATDLAMQFYRAANCRDLLRVDFIVGSDGKIYTLEANSIPGFTASSLVPKAAQQAGMSFERLCARLAQMAWKRK